MFWEMCFTGLEWIALIGLIGFPICVALDHAEALRFGRRP